SAVSAPGPHPTSRARPSSGSPAKSAKGTASGLEKRPMNRSYASASLKLIQRLELGRSCAVEDRTRRAPRRTREAARRRVRGLVCERVRDCLGLVLAGREEEELARVAETRQRQGDPVDERFVSRLRADDVAARDVERGEVREERGDMAVRAESEEDEIEGADIR